MSRNQWNRSQGKQTESRVSNPFGAVASTGNVFGGTQAPVNPFQQQQRVPTNFSQPKSNPGNGRFRPNQTPDRGMSMMGDDSEQGVSSQQRVSNPFASLAGAHQTNTMSLEDAVRSYKNDVRTKRGYPFSCLGPPDMLPILGGDISPEELRWYLSQGDVSIQRLIGERASVLNEDYSDFLRGACGEGVALNIQRVGPYRIPDAAFPEFVPRGTFRIVERSNVAADTSSEEWRAYESEKNGKPMNLPRLAPPLEYR